MKKLGCITAAVLIVVGIFAIAWIATSPDSKEPIPEVTKAGETICVLDGVTFTKKNDGKAYVGLYYNQKGAIVPILVSEDREAVSFITSLSDQEHGSAAFSYQEEEYYYSWSDSIAMYTEERQKNDNLPLLFISGVDTCGGAKAELLKQLKVQQAGGPLMHFVKYYLIWFIVIPVAIYICLRYFGQKDDSDSYVGGGTTTTNRDRMLSEIDEMQTLNRINQTINSPGYDSNSFGPPSDI